MKFYIKLTQIQSTHDRLRTKTIEGFCYHLPELNKSFQMFGQGLTMGIRWIRTSLVKHIQQITNGYHIYTENSEYKIEIQDMETGDKQ